MFLKNIKTFIKQLYKNKLYSLVTILGFSISLMFVILLSIYIKQEVSVDRFHEKKDRLFRLVNEGESHFGSTTGKRIQEAFPEVECQTRVYCYGDYFYASGATEKKLDAELLMVDSTFFRMFSFSLEEGNPKDVLVLKNSAVLTRQFATSLFGDESPIGKQIVSSNNVRLEVTGIVEELPENTQFKKCDAIVNFQTQADFWGYPELLTSDASCIAAYYFLAKENTDLPSKNLEVTNFLKKDLWLYKDERVKTLDFEPITDSYFSNKKGEDIKQNSKTLISVLTVIALLILILAIINYVNLTIAQSGFRNKEIAIRKLMGSSRKRLIWQHISESVFLCFIALGIGVVMSIIAEPVFNNLLETKISLTNTINITSLVLLVVFIFGVGIISGLIPALHLTGLNPADVVKGNFRKKNKTVYSKLLVSFQFATTIALIICAVTITKQTQFLCNYDMGFKKENIVVINSGMIGDKRQTFSNLLHRIPGVEQISYVAGSPLDGGNNQSMKHNDTPVSFQEFIVDSAFFTMLGINYEKTGVAWSKNCLWLNQTAIKELNLEALPKTFKRYEEELPIYGVVEDFHFGDLHKAIGPAMLRPMSEKQYAWSILVKISGANISKTMKDVKSNWDEFTGGRPFDYQFIDAVIDHWYKKETNASKIISWFSFLAIIISVMGILALVTYYNQLRVKEIGIRKVNGAKINEIVTMLNKDFIKWVIVAFIVASPIAWYAMTKWLENFAYKTALSWWVFALAGIITVSIALLTVSWQTWRTARRNPVEALRYE